MGQQARARFIRGREETVAAEEEEFVAVGEAKVRVYDGFDLRVVLQQTRGQNTKSSRPVRFAKKCDASLGAHHISHNPVRPWVSPSSRPERCAVCAGSGAGLRRVAPIPSVPTLGSATLRRSAAPCLFAPVGSRRGHFSSREALFAASQSADQALHRLVQQSYDAASFSDVSLQCDAHVNALVSAVPCDALHSVAVASRREVLPG